MLPRSGVRWCVCVLFKRPNPSYILVVFCPDSKITAPFWEQKYVWQVWLVVKQHPHARQEQTPEQPRGEDCRNSLSEPILQRHIPQSLGSLHSYRCRAPSLHPFPDPIALLRHELCVYVMMTCAYLCVCLFGFLQRLNYVLARHVLAVW